MSRCGGRIAIRARCVKHVSRQYRERTIAAKVHSEGTEGCILHVGIFPF